MTHTIKRIKRPNKEKKRCADRCCYSIDTFSGLTQIPNEMNKGENEALVLFRASGVEWKTFLWLWLHHIYKTSSAQTFTHTITQSIARCSTFLISQKKKHNKIWHSLSFDRFVWYIFYTRRFYGIGREGGRMNALLSLSWSLFCFGCIQFIALSVLAYS